MVNILADVFLLLKREYSKKSWGFIWRSPPKIHCIPTKRCYTPEKGFPYQPALCLVLFLMERCPNLSMICAV